MKLLILLLLAMQTVSTVAPQPRYREGQVWAYKTRPGDEGSLLKIQHIEQNGSTPIYHISVIGFHFRTPGFTGPLPHAPVSENTLDKSVTELRPDPGTFPSADEGIAQWRQAHGGVFTTTVAEAIDFMEQALSTGRSNGG